MIGVVAVRENQAVFGESDIIRRKGARRRKEMDNDYYERIFGGVAPGDDAYYPVNNEMNQALYEKYLAKAVAERVIFGGRLGEYQYYDMDKTVERALALARSLSA